METNAENAQLKKSSINSIISLFAQSGYAAVLGLVANFTVTYLLTPTIFGIYAITLSIIAILNYFSDIGLAGSLIQKKTITDEDVKTTFTVQQALIISLVVFAYLVTPIVMSYLRLPEETKYLYWALLGSFFISSLKTIPSIFLERKVQFSKIVYVQILENTIFYSTVIILAVMGFKIHSFTVAVLLRAVSGLLFMYILSPWKPQLGYSHAHFKELVSFGAPFQASSLLALVKDELIYPLFLGRVLGLAGVGYIQWAKKWAEAPIRIIMDNITRVLFPVFSRIQDDREKVGRLVETILRYQTMILAPSIVGLALLMKPIVELLPKYSKWEPALPLFYIFCISTIFSSYSTPFINLLNALGKIKTSFKFMLFWTAGTWILTPLLTISLMKYHAELYGFPLTILLLSLAFVIVVVITKKEVSFNFFRPITPFLISAVFMSISTIAMLSFFQTSVIQLFFTVLISMATYLLILLLVFKINVITEVYTRFLKR
ncbi:MAG: oligosaccharide flippase family protein [Patescibacteria group bacterium]